MIKDMIEIIISIINTLLSIIKNTIVKYPFFAFGFILGIIIEIYSFRNGIYIQGLTSEYYIVLLPPFLSGMVLQLLSLIIWNKLDPSLKKKLEEKKIQRNNKRIWNRMTTEQKQLYISRRNLLEKEKEINDLIAYQKTRNKEFKESQEKALYKLVYSAKDNLTDTDRLYIGCTTKEELKHRYLGLLKIYHPDNSTGNEDMTLKLKESYERISKLIKK